jgi:hypothetical protein
MSEIINAFGYPFANTDYRKEFEKILLKIIDCYNLMIVENISLTNDENYIRDILLMNYLNDNPTRKKINLTDFLFDREVPEDKSLGRTDIKIQTLNTFQDTRAYYIIECKRLDAKNPNGITGLNAEYVKNGICRFVTGYYSSYFGINGMIGFVVENFDIDKNIIHINSFLNQDLTNNRGGNVNAMPIQVITPIKISEDFNHCYTSSHQASTRNEIVLYHLMFNFSKNIL